MIKPLFTTLDVLLSNRCTMQCDYCHLPPSEDKPANVGGILKGVSDFLNQHIPLSPKRPSPALTINVMGGEPLLEWNTLSALVQSVNAIRGTVGLDITLKVKTNLLLLDADKLKFLNDNGAIICPRIDGCRAAHDAFRVDANNDGTYLRVIEKAQTLLEVQPNATVRMNIMPTTVDYYADSIKALYKMGFMNIEVAFPNCEWATEAFSLLHEETQTICNWYLNEIVPVDNWLRISFIEDTLERLKRGGPLEPCGAGVTRRAIDGSGAIYPCYRLQDKTLELDTVYHVDIPDRDKLCADCEMAQYCGRPCYARMSVCMVTEEEKADICPSPEFCQIERTHFSAALRMIRTLHWAKIELPPRFARVALPESPGEQGADSEKPVEQENSPPPPPTKSTPLVTAAERVKDRKEHPFGVPPGAPAPPQTDEVFTTVEPKFLVSVVYASRNEGSEVHDTVKSALDAATGPIEIIVVDDASIDGSCADVEALNREGGVVRWIRLNSPVGAGMARNVGFAAARGRVVVSSDMHMRYPKGMWHEIGGFALEKQAIVCPGCAAMFGGPQGWGATLNYHRDGKIGCSYYRARGTEPERTDGVLGACYFVPREIFDELTRWPSLLGLWGYEESTINMWAYFHDVPCYCYPKYMTRHLYRSEAKDGTKEPPWGFPPTSDLNMNHAMNHLALFERETYMNVWRPHYLPYLSQHHRQMLEMAERGMLYETGHWRRRKAHTDYECFRDVLKVPVIKGPNETVRRVRPISVILTAYNEGREVAKTVHSIVQSGQTRFEIIIVDDASTDGSVPADLADRLRGGVAAHWKDDLHGRIKIIRHEQRRGVSQSRAEAIAASRGEMVCIMDAHQRIITKYGIEWAAAHAQDKDGIVVMNVCNLGNAKKTDKRTYGARFTCKKKWGLLNTHVTTKPEEEIAPRDTIIGAGYVLSKEVIERMGGWPTLPGLWAYQEQSVALRCWVLGIPMFAARDITAEHMYKKGNLPIPLESTILNAHLVHYLFFGDEVYDDYFKPALLHHGWFDSVGEYLKRDDVQEARAMWALLKEERGKTDELFFREMLQYEGDWPPVWKDE